MNHHALIRRLIAEIRALREEAATREYYDQERESRRIAQASRDARNAEYERQQAEHDRWAREDWQRRMAERLESAHRYGDEWEKSRLREQLKRGW